jgi:hypothetical protein
VLPTVSAGKSHKEDKNVSLTRRDVIIGAGGFACALMSGATAVGQTPKLKVMVAGGHPGDPEYGCGGTIARLTNLGHQVVLLYLNNGAWPPTDAATRTAEATHACQILKARPAYAGQANGHAIVDNDHYADYAKIIDTEKPDMVITQWPLDNHRDHRAITMLTYDAFLCTITKFLTEKIPCNSLPPTTSTSPKQNRSSGPPVMRTPVKRRTDTMRCRIRSRLSAASRAATSEPKLLCFSCKALPTR